MENRIFSDVKGGLIITPKTDRHGGGNTKTKEKVITPLKLTNSNCQTAKFGLNRRTRNCRLFLGLTGVKGIANINTVASDRMPKV